METRDLNPESLPPQLHEQHRLLDVTDIGHIHRRLLCLDCKMEFELPATGPDRSWMERAP